MANTLQSSKALGDLAPSSPFSESEYAIAHYQQILVAQLSTISVLTGHMTTGWRHLLGQYSGWWYKMLSAKMCCMLSACMRVAQVCTRRDC